MRRLSGTLGFKGGALYWYAVGVGSALIFFMFWEWVSPKSVAKWWEPLSAVATACAAGVALLLGTADIRRRNVERRQNAKALRVYLETELSRVQREAHLFIDLVDKGVIAPTDPASVQSERRRAGRRGSRLAAARHRSGHSVDDEWRQSLRFCIGELSMPMAQQQFAMFASLPETEAAILAGIVSGVVRLRSGLLIWLKRATFVPVDLELLSSFRANAEEIIQIVDRLDWMRDGAPLSAYG